MLTTNTPEVQQPVKIFPVDVETMTAMLSFLAQQPYYLAQPLIDKLRAIKPVQVQEPPKQE